MRVLLNIWSPFFLSHVGEFGANFYFLALRKQFPDLEFCLPPRVAVAAANVKYALQKALDRLPWRRMPPRLLEPWLAFRRISYLPAWYVRRSAADVVLSYASDPWPWRGYRAGRVQFSHLPSERYFQMFGLRGQLPAEIKAKRRVLQAADIVICRDPASAERVHSWLQVPVERIRCIPVYDPHHEPLNEAEVTRKHGSDQEVRMLFVGADGWRKGLPNLLAAWSSLPSGTRAKARLTVVSREDAALRSQLAACEGVEFIPTPVPGAQVRCLMEEAHVFAAPTLYDSYGRAVTEAMARGCCVITSRQDPQDWMVDYGRAGFLVDPQSPDEIGAALHEAIESPSCRGEKGMAARERFMRVFHHRVVGEQLYEALRTACERAEG